MIYLIGQLALWLLLTAAFMALVGWVVAAQRAAPEELALRRERDGILRDLARIGDGPREEHIVDDDASRRLLEIRDGRIAELERMLEAARSRADGAASELAALQRRISAAQVDAEELTRLRALAAEREREIEAPAEPVVDESVALQAWRLRYFEQRVKYLEGLPKPQAEPETVVVREPEPPLNEWRAREATERADYLENELRALRARAEPEPEPVEPESPFAANADVDALLRWRLLYMERRVAHLQGELARASAPEPVPEPAPVVEAPRPDPDLWKWRARYLEARVRHLETARAVIPVMMPAAELPAAPGPAPTGARRTKPPALSAARNGAPDDFTLIEGVSSLQQTTLYSLGVFHFDQIAAWTPENVAWVDHYLRLQGRIGEQEWVEQADDLARHGVVAARRVHESEDA